MVFESTIKQTWSISPSPSPWSQPSHGLLTTHWIPALEGHFHPLFQRQKFPTPDFLALGLTSCCVRTRISSESQVWKPWPVNRIQSIVQVWNYNLKTNLRPITLGGVYLTKAQSRIGQQLEQARTQRAPPSGVPVSFYTLYVEAKHRNHLTGLPLIWA